LKRGERVFEALDLEMIFSRFERRESFKALDLGKTSLFLKGENRLRRWTFERSLDFERRETIRH